MVSKKYKTVEKKVKPAAIYQFLLEEVFCRYGCVGQVIADRGKLDSDKAREFFAKHGVRLTLMLRDKLNIRRIG